MKRGFGKMPYTWIRVIPVEICTPGRLIVEKYLIRNACFHQVSSLVSNLQTILNLGPDWQERDLWSLGLYLTLQLKPCSIWLDGIFSTRTLLLPIIIFREWHWCYLVFLLVLAGRSTDRWAERRDHTKNHEMTWKIKPVGSPGHDASRKFLN